jgi:chromosome segregation ATPase
MESGRLEKRGGGEKERGGAGEGGEKGKPRNVVKGAIMREERQRRDSVSTIDEMWKKKREKGEKEGKEAEKNRKIATITDEGEEMKEILIEIRKEVRELRSQGQKTEDNIRQEVRKLREEMEERERRWAAEKEKLKGRIEKLEEGVKGQEGKEERMRKMEARMEIKEREERRGNIVIKGLGNNKSSIKEEVETLVKEVMNLKVELKEVREIGKRLGKGRRMAIVKLGSMEEKRQVMQKKGMLKGREERIEDDWTWKERKMQHKLRCIAEEERREGRRVRIRYGHIEIEKYR